MPTTRKRYIVHGQGIWRIKTLPMLLADVELLFRPLFSKKADAVLAWGRKPSSRKAARYAARHKLACHYIEDGFLRSFNTGPKTPPLSLVLDETGIYYDSRSPSALETMLESEQDLLHDIQEDVTQAHHLILNQKLSKYNHAPLFSPPPASEYSSHAKRILVIDQTCGDLSVELGGADSSTFRNMLAAARTENPGATIYVKTHPEVSSGRKRGYLTDVQDDAHTIVLREALNPLSLIERMDKVYVVTSTMGFEALLAGKPVTVFGLPWYAGWGVTDDRQHCQRRQRRRSVMELFAAAYFHYSRYLNPVTHEPGTIFDVIQWLIHQRKMALNYPGRMVAVSFPLWRQYNLRGLLSLYPGNVCFVRNTQAAESLALSNPDCLICWGRNAPEGSEALAQKRDLRLLYMEDGFIRSVGLGSDFILPQSVTLDAKGIYFDPSRPSVLEHILENTRFSAEELERARQIQTYIVTHGLTKYNMESREPVSWDTQNKLVVLVPGQVEDDASIRYGCAGINTNLKLLEQARQSRPDAFIVYKPHPDVMSGNRKGRMALEQARHWANHIETHSSIVSCLDACDEVHTMTSLTGFDALLRNKQVVVYGQPFYAGWGLTKDMLPDAPAFQRRSRRLSLDELVAGVLLHYPVYWDWDLQGYTTCESVLQDVVRKRTELEAKGKLAQLKTGRFRRLLRKLQVLLPAWAKFSLAGH